jgi:hypothetical protein
MVNDGLTSYELSAWLHSYFVICCVWFADRVDLRTSSDCDLSQDHHTFSIVMKSLNILC